MNNNEREQKKQRNILHIMKKMDDTTKVISNF